MIRTGSTISIMKNFISISLLIFSTFFSINTINAQLAVEPNGIYYFQVYNQPDFYLGLKDYGGYMYGALIPVTNHMEDINSTFEMVPCPNCTEPAYYLQSISYPDYYLYTSPDGNIYLTKNDESQTFIQGALFYVLPGLADAQNGISLGAYHYPDHYVSFNGEYIYLQKNQYTATYNQFSTFYAINGNF